MKVTQPAGFSLFRAIFGTYLTVHFLQLIPNAAELFSGAGLLSDPNLNLLPQIFPNPLLIWNSVEFSVLFVTALAALSMALTCGMRRRLCALALAFGWACLFNRNNLISNPSIPYTGLMLLYLAVIPSGEPRWPWQPLFRRDWSMPRSILIGAWILLAAGYSFSGYWKFISPSWLDGTAMIHVLENPLARPNALRTLLLQLPQSCLHAMTWSVLLLEMAALPLAAIRFGRALTSVALIAIHIGIMAVVDFADLTFGMLMAHLFVFDTSWFARQSATEPSTHPNTHSHWRANRTNNDTPKFTSGDKEAIRAQRSRRQIVS